MCFETNIITHELCKIDSFCKHRSFLQLQNMDNTHTRTHISEGGLGAECSKWEWERRGAVQEDPGDSYIPTISICFLTLLSVFVSKGGVWKIGMGENGTKKNKVTGKQKGTFRALLVIFLLLSPYYLPPNIPSA